MFSLNDAVNTVDFALKDGQTGDIILRKMHSVCLCDLMDLFDGARVEVVGKRPCEKTHETLYVKGEITTGYETEEYYVLNRRAEQILPMDTIDSSQVSRVEPQRLRQWFEDVRGRMAA
jgi:FlaA1/EpsC-like NDP-sugar epimerase